MKGTGAESLKGGPKGGGWGGVVASFAENSVYAGREKILSEVHGGSQVVEKVWQRALRFHQDRPHNDENGIVDRLGAEEKEQQEGVSSSLPKAHGRRLCRLDLKPPGMP